MTQITMAIDALERQVGKGNGPLDSEGLVPIYLGAGLIEPIAFDNWADAGRAVTGLTDEVNALAPSTRKMFLSAMCRSLAAAVRTFSGEQLDFATMLTELVGVPASEVAAGTVETTHDILDRLLTQAGYTNGDLGARTRAWQADRWVDRNDIPKVFEELMAEARKRTADHIYDSVDYTMRLRPISDVPYTARCNFNEGFMDLNLDLAFTRANLKHLVCHEVFPGHSTQLLYTRDAFAAGRASADVLLCTTNAVTGCVQEGMGDQGIELIDWVEDVDDAIQVQLRRLASAVATNAAWYLMGEHRAEAEVASYLESKAFGQPAWVSGRIRLARHPFRGPFIASYWFGNEAVRVAREDAEALGRTDDFVTYLYGRMHSPESLMKFKDAA
jgi:hypothetical protein